MPSQKQKLIDKRARLVDESEKIQEEGFTDESRVRFDEIDAEIEAVDADIDRAKKAEKRELEMKTVNDWAAPEAEPKPDPPSVTVRDLSEEDPKRGYRDVREYLVSVMDFYRYGKLDSRLKPLQVQAAAGADEQHTLSDPYGGFAMPTAFSPEMLRLTPEDLPIFSMATQIPMQASIVEIPARVDKNHTSSVTGGLTVSRHADTAAATASRFELEKISLNAYELIGLAYASEMLLRTSPISFAALIQQGFRDEFNSRITNEMISGSGVGEFQGVLESPALISITKESSQTADTLKYENIIKMRARCYGYSNAVWIANHDTIPELMTMAYTASGIAPIWQPSLREDHPDVLLGRPLYFSEYAPTLGDVGDVMLVNWREYLVGTLHALEGAESIHVRFSNNERTFRFWMANAGVPWWSAALTPKKSTTTLSPFVAVAARA